jgi:hypothetical protein
MADRQESTVVSGGKAQKAEFTNAGMSWNPDASFTCKPPLQLPSQNDTNLPAWLTEQKEVIVTVGLNPLELKLLRRAIAHAADEHLLDATLALNRICALDALRWEAEEDAKADEVGSVMHWLANRRWAIGNPDIEQITGWNWKTGTRR